MIKHDFAPNYCETGKQNDIKLLGLSARRHLCKNHLTGTDSNHNNSFTLRFLQEKHIISLQMQECKLEWVLQDLQLLAHGY